MGPKDGWLGLPDLAGAQHNHLPRFEPELQIAFLCRLRSLFKLSQAVYAITVERVHQAEELFIPYVHLRAQYHQEHHDLLPFEIGLPEHGVELAARHERFIWRHEWDEDEPAQYQ
eukprot:CAMPEP_0182847428 /NCGR_PEP_ID=MMETSP0006_2-20121128/28455_1 /TAXON_ID=97485 /ORGANISM="Prymnesium parvum, Strain Texoma1" /LENGTH=114 /DNA_ID=CAMNT_0024977765 /DNA_START=116 /DNA_END=457 /DNA_ORIENTATION=+